MMPELTLSVEKRQVLGRKVKKLRQEGVLPANIYGKKTKSLAVKVKLTDFKKIYQQAGETGLVELQVKGENKTRSVLIHNLQLHPVTDRFLHIDFHQVVLTEKTKALVPIEVVGKPKAVAEKKGVLLTILPELAVEALPKDLPEKLTIDVSKLEVNEQILVKDIKRPKEVTIINEPDEVVVKIGALAKEEEEAPPPPKEEEVPVPGGEEVKKQVEGEREEVRENKKKALPGLDSQKERHMEKRKS